MNEESYSKVSSRLFIHATNISQGGGKSLLNALFSATPRSYPVIAQLDSRMQLKDSSDSWVIRRVRATIFYRLYAEWWLAKNVKRNDVAVCFGNLPPLFRLKGKAVVFVQNRYLIERNSLANFSLKIRLRILFERIWLKWMASNADEFVVQTPTMRTLMFKAGYLNGQMVHVKPFISGPFRYQRTVHTSKNQRQRDYDFVYVASGEPHKNHRQLIEAWCLLAEQNLYPSLCLTLNLDNFGELLSWLELKKSRYHLRIVNVGSLSHPDALNLYNKASALIYPSRLESFGLPLIEATIAGLSILASECDYVRDVLDPAETFDPQSPLSIARAVKRYLGVKESGLELADAASFFEFLVRDFLTTPEKL